jgi:hypothetical protein
VPDIEIQHGCGQTLTVAEGELAICPRCRKQIAAFAMTEMTPAQEAFAANLHPHEMIDSLVFDQVLRRYGELLDRYLNVFAWRLRFDGISEPEIEAEVGRVRGEWAL